MYQQIRLDAGGSLTFAPPQNGRSSSAVYTLYKPDGSTVIGAAGRTATNDTVNTTLSGSAAAGSTSVSLAASTGLAVGRRYLMTAAADNEIEWIRVLAFTSAGVVTLAEPLRQDYASSDTFVGNRLTLDVDSGDAGDLDQGFEARLTYVVAGVSYLVPIYFDVVRTVWPEVILRPDEFRRYAGALSATALERSSADGLQFIDEIAIATELLRADIVDRGLRPDLFRGFDGFRRAVAMRVLLEWSLDGVNLPAAYHDTPEMWVDQCRARSEESFNRALSTVETYDEDGDASVSDAERAARLSSIRITR